MDVKVLRIEELTAEQLLALGLLIRGEIHTKGSEWVCQARQQPAFWGDEYLAKVAADPKARAVGVWVGLIDGVPKGVCWVADGEPDREIIMFLIDISLAAKEGVALADTIALRSLNDMLADDSGKGDIVSLFPVGTPAAAYAANCGMSSSDAYPDAKQWRIGMKALRDNIAKRVTPR